MALPQIVLASQSPARLQLLRNIGIEPQVIVSHVDEDAVAHERGWSTPHDLSQGLAQAKARAVADELESDAIVIGCDSVMEFEGNAYGKPADAAEAQARLSAMSGSSGFLYTGHHVIHLAGGERHEVGALCRTEVRFHSLSEAEIEAYIATGEPLKVAGSYTLDSLGGPFIKEISGDASNVVGLSVSTLRLLLAQLGFGWELVLDQVTAK